MNWFISMWDAMPELSYMKPDNHGLTHTDPQKLKQEEINKENTSGLLSCCGRLTGVQTVSTLTAILINI